MIILASRWKKAIMSLLCISLPKQLAPAKVMKINKKMILIKRLGTTTTRGKGTYRYSEDVVKIDSKLLTIKALKE